MRDAKGNIKVRDVPYYAGVAPRARILSFKVLDQNGAGYTSQVIQALDYIIEHKEQLKIPKTMTTGGAEVKALAAQTSEAWIAFARIGNPNHRALPVWPAYATTQRATMVFDAPASKVVNDPGRRARALDFARLIGQEGQCFDRVTTGSPWPRYYARRLRGRNPRRRSRSWRLRRPQGAGPPGADRRQAASAFAFLRRHRADPSWSDRPGH